MNPFARAVSESEDYVPSYLSRVTPEAFTLIDDRWHATARGYMGEEVHYTLRIDGDVVTEVTVNGEVISDIPTLAERPETVLEWYDAIVYLDACGREMDRQNPRWEGEGLDAELFRLEHNVVQCVEYPVRLSAFDSPEGLEKYLNQILAATPLGIQVQPLRAWPREATEGGMGDISCIVDPGEPDLYSPVPYSTDYSGEEWLGFLESFEYDSYVYALYPDAHAAPETASAGAGSAYRVSELPEYVEFGHAGEATPWWALIFPQLDFLLLISPADTTLRVVIDNDCASVSVQSLFRPKFAARHHLQERYQRRWGRLADDSRAHSNAEVSRAIQTALNAIGADREA